MVEHQDFQSRKQKPSIEQNISMHNVQMISSSSMVKQMLKTRNQKQMMKMQIMDDIEHAEHKCIFLKPINVQNHMCHTFVQFIDNTNVLDQNVEIQNREMI
jgi:hypothetical protein